MRPLFSFPMAFLILFSIAIVKAETIHVPEDQPTIQAGIDAAAQGDTVLVADGTYREDGNWDISFLGKAIVVMSENGPENCVIDCLTWPWQDPHRGFLFLSGEDSNSVLKGFTIKDGRSYDSGAGIYCSNSSPTITGNIVVGSSSEGGGGGIGCEHNSSPTIKGNTIAGNSGKWYGGGIYCRSGSSPTITDNTIMDNGSGDNYGGGIYCDDSSPSITGNTIIGNRAPSGGGGIGCSGDSSPTITGNMILWNGAFFGGAGIYCRSGSSPTITDNTISFNTSREGAGGGIRCINSSPTIKGNTIAGNVCGSHGGGIYCQSGSSLTITDNTISFNTTRDELFGSGGGIYCSNSSPTIKGNTIAGNVCGSYYGGGGIYCSSGSSPTIMGNTVMGNTAADGRGGGIYCMIDSSPIITNSILWGDSPDEIYCESGNPVVGYSDIEGGWIGEGNIDVDPIFVLPDTWDCRLLWNSPCIDTGYPDSLDADGTRSDIGAHYFNQDDYLTLYITPDKRWAVQGEQVGVTYTAINRWAVSEHFWILTQVIQPDGTIKDVIGPEEYTLPAESSVQYRVVHTVPLWFPNGESEYTSLIGIPPSTLYDWDRFKFWILE